MANLKDIFSNLKDKVVGTSTDKIDNKLDLIVKDIANYRSGSTKSTQIELLKRLISKTQNINFIGGSLFGQGNNPASFGQGTRLMRYKAYEAIVSHINYCHRALNVLTDNILAPDDITKKSLEINPSQELENEDDTESRVKLVQQLVKKTKLEENLDRITENTLKFGDFFCEIADTKTAITSRSIISENFYNYQMNEGVVDPLRELITTDGIQVIMDYHAFDEAVGNVSVSIDDEKPKPARLDNVKLLYHEPKFVVKLQSAIFPICFGYLVFPQASISPGEMLKDEAINNICVSILKSLEGKIPQMNEFKGQSELKDMLKILLAQTDFNKSLNIRYVPPDRMQHFSLPSTKYYPYGESIFDSCQFTAKALIALEVSISIARINKSVDKRKIGIEMGLPRDTMKQVQALKEEMRKRKVSLDGFGSVDTIACLDLETKIQMSNGISMPLKDIISQFECGNDNMFVYSYDPESGTIFPNKIIEAKITGRNVPIIKITLDNDEEILCTKEHRFMLRDGNWCEAQNLEYGDSLMPFCENEIKIVKSVDFIDLKMDVGDIEVEKHSNFAIEQGIIIHNSSISSFEDIYLPTRDGKEMVTFSTLESTDNRSHIEEAKFMRDQIVAGMGVPPAVIGLEENVYKCLDLQTKIPFLSGKNKTIKELSEIFEREGKFEDDEVFSYDNEANAIVPGKIIWAGVTRRNAEVLKITLDNEEEIICTPDHKFIMRDGTEKEAQYLNPYDSLMPLYTRMTSYKTKEKKLPYRQFRQVTKSNRWQHVYKMVAEFNIGRPLEKDEHVHHRNHIPIDDRCKNIQVLSKEDHIKIHEEYRQYKQKRGRGFHPEDYEEVICEICNKKWTKHIADKSKTCGDDYCKKELKHRAAKEAGKQFRTGKDMICPYCGKTFYRKVSEMAPSATGVFTCGDIECRRKSYTEFRNSEEGKNKTDRPRIKGTYVKCFICEKEIYKMPSELKKKKTDMFFCDDPKCKEQGYSILWKMARSKKIKGKKSNRIYEKTGEYLNCRYCGKEIYKTQSTIKNNKYGFFICDDPACIQKKNTEISRSRSLTGKLVKCKYCGKELYKRPSDLKRSISGEFHCNGPECRSKHSFESNSKRKLNHKVIAISIIEERIDTGCITVDKYHNFAVDSGVFVKNSVASEESAYFARTIIAHQKPLNSNVISLISKILMVIQPDTALTILDNVQINLPSPKSLQYEREARYMTEVANLIETLDRIGIPKDYSRRKYLTSMDWIEIEKYKTDEKIEKSLDPEKKAEDQSSGFGGTGFGGGFSPTSF